MLVIDRPPEAREPVARKKNSPPDPGIKLLFVWH